jgi:hypothetical protein
MRAYAREGGEDEDLWGITGLVHDLDYERYPDLETGHPALRARRSSRHAGTPGVRRGRRRSCGLHGRAAHDAAGEDALRRSTSSPGFIGACALVRPTGHRGMKPKSVRKKLKQPSFAAKVDREQIHAASTSSASTRNEHEHRGSTSRRSRCRADALLALGRGLAHLDRVASPPPSPGGFAQAAEEVGGSRRQSGDAVCSPRVGRTPEGGWTLAEIGPPPPRISEHERSDHDRSPAARRAHRRPSALPECSTERCARGGQNRPVQQRNAARRGRRSARRRG